MNLLEIRPLLASAAALTLLGACASSPPANSLATVTPSDLQAGHAQAIKVRQALQAAGRARGQR